MPILELSTLGGWGQYEDIAPGAGLVIGTPVATGESVDSSQLPVSFVAETDGDADLEKGE